MTVTEFATRIPEMRENGIYMVENNIDFALMYKYEQTPIKESVKQLVARCRPRSVMELGFGYGYTSDEFQRLRIDTHIIIESNNEIYRQAVAWQARQVRRANIRIINARWQDLKEDFDVDLLYDDTYELVTPDIPKDFSHIKHKWFANCWCDTPTDDINLGTAYFEFDGGIQFLIRGNNA